MSKKYIIGIDQGSQSCKIMIFDLKGNIVCEGREPLRPYSLPSPGIVEHPEDDWWTSLCVASKKCMEKFEGDVKDILSIGLCTIRFCRAYMKEDGTLAQPAMSWMDIRVSKPYEHVNKDVKYASASSGYISFRLTGEFKDSAANYLGMWPMDTDTWQWLKDEEEFESYGFKREMLPQLIMPGDIIGNITEAASKATGLPFGIPVVATANDKAVEGLGVGCIGDKTIAISLGTYITSMMEGNGNPKNTTGFWTNLACEPNKYLYESDGIRRGMWTVSWFKDVLGDAYEAKANSLGLDAVAYLDEESKDVPPGSEGLITIPEWLAPTDKLYKKGMMIGFDGRHTRAHMYRSILESIALTLKYKVDDMVNELGVKPETIIVSGGGSNSETFMQIFSDVFNLKAVRNVVNGAAGLGAAICAAVALNEYTSFDEAVKNMVQIKDEFNPIKENVELYSELLEVYKDVTSYTDPLLERTYKIFS